MGVRFPSVVVILVGGMFFLLYLLPWQSLPSVPFPSPSSFPRSRVVVNSNVSLMTLEYPLLDVDPLAESPPLQQYQPHGLVTYRAMVESGVTFNVTGSDVLVILHIQKTGGTSFEKHIVQDLVIDKPCVCWKKRKRCKCPRPPSRGNAINL